MAGDAHSAETDGPVTITVGQGDGHARGPGAAPPAPGKKIGRFIVLQPLGVGGMGMVVAAYDPQLDRKVALKLLRSDVAPSHATAAVRARLLHEAQAMAKLRHPNVVAVFEVGEYEGQVFLAMEHVEGGTLREWAESRRHARKGWQQILTAFAEAGRGLEAAHEQDLIHRDFKPTNVLIEGDRIQVTDFGIASIEGREPTLDRDGQPVVQDRNFTPTRPTMVLGTTPYMAPELLEGAPADAKTDQFAFCASLFESLYGHRPFQGESVEEIAGAMKRGEVVAPVQTFGVPDWVKDAIYQGLDANPARRWGSMSDLIAVLDSPDHAELGRTVRVGIAAAIGLGFVLLPLLARELGPPFDRSTYAGAVGQTLALLAILLTMAVAYRKLLLATAINRKAFFGVVSVLAMQLPLELGSMQLGLSVQHADILHMVLWAGMAGMFAATVDLRFLLLSASYLVCFAIALVWPAHHLLMLGLSNGAFVAFVMSVWRSGSDSPPPPLPPRRERLGESAARTGRASTAAPATADSETRTLAE